MQEVQFQSTFGKPRNTALCSMSDISGADAQEHSWQMDHSQRKSIIHSQQVSDTELRTHSLVIWGQDLRRNRLRGVSW